VGGVLLLEAVEGGVERGQRLHVRMRGGALLQLAVEMWVGLEKVGEGEEGRGM
jgi:hypothetical protein